MTSVALYLCLDTGNTSREEGEVTKKSEPTTHNLIIFGLPHLLLA